MMSRRLPWSMLAAGLLALAGCKAKSRAPEPGVLPGDATREKDAGEARERAAEARPAATTRQFRAATYNAGLAAGLLKYTEERAGPLVHALAEQKADLLCVQEFWLEEHWQKLVSTAADTLPHTYRLPSDEVKASCEASEVEPIVTCVATHCAGRPLHEVSSCLLASCQAPIMRLSPGCFQCVTADPRRKPVEIARTCAGRAWVERREAEGARNGARPQSGPESFRVYSGSHGTGILTNATILERDARILPSALDRRAALYARLATPVGELHAFCTHLTSTTTRLPPPGYASWQALQEAQIGVLLDFMEQKARGGTVLLLGDLNTGPAIAPLISSSLPGHYARILGRGFVNPYASRNDAKCTYCFDNPLEGGRGTHGVLIDHVMLRGFEGEVEGMQFMRPGIELEVGGKPVKSGFSDHYGVIVTLSKREA